MSSKIEEVIKKYPKIFPPVALMTSTDKEGWAGLLEILCKVLQSDVDNKKHKQVVIRQVLRDITRLHLYVSVSDDYQIGQIRLIEWISLYVCDTCGAMENELKLEGWLSTKCDACFNKERDEYNAK